MERRRSEVQALSYHLAPEIAYLHSYRYLAQHWLPRTLIVTMAQGPSQIVFVRRVLGGLSLRIQSRSPRWRILIQNRYCRWPMTCVRSASWICRCGHSHMVEFSGKLGWIMLSRLISERGMAHFRDGEHDDMSCSCKHVLVWGPDRDSIKRYLLDLDKSSMYSWMPVVTDPRPLTEFVLNIGHQRGVRVGPDTLLPNPSVLITTEEDLMIEDHEANTHWKSRVLLMEGMINRLRVPEHPPVPRIFLMPLQPRAVSSFTEDLAPKDEAAAYKHHA